MLGLARTQDERLRTLVPFPNDIGTFPQGRNLVSLQYEVHLKEAGGSNKLRRQPCGVCHRRETDGIPVDDLHFVELAAGARSRASC